jgi:DNA-binding NarL/FixJ family response regulator
MTTTAGALQASPAWAPATATVVGDDPHARRRVARILGEAGFAVCVEPEAGGVIVLAAAAREDARLRAIRALAAAQPAAAILAVIPAGGPNTAVRRVLLAGAAGVVVEEDIERALVPAARAILAGQLTIPIAFMQQIAPRPLSHREKQILSLVVLGMTNREIANRLFLAESTVKTHLASAFRKIDARSRAEAVARIEDPESGYGPAILAASSGAAA